MTADSRKDYRKAVSMTTDSRNFHFTFLILYLYIRYRNQLTDVIYCLIKTNNNGSIRFRTELALWCWFSSRLESSSIPN